MKLKLKFTQEICIKKIKTETRQRKYPTVLFLFSDGDNLRF